MLFSRKPNVYAPKISTYFVALREIYCRDRPVAKIILYPLWCVECHDWSGKTIKGKG